MNLHPPLTAFPVALITTAALLELLAAFRFRVTLEPVIRILLCAGAVTALAAFFSGYQASELANQTFTVPDEPLALHHNVGRLLLFAIIPCAALCVFGARAVHGRRFFRLGYLVFLAASVGLVVYAGYLGGQLVFTYGAGVEAKL